MVPNPLGRQVVELAHQSNLGGHLGSRRTIGRVFSNSTGPQFEER